MRFPNIKIGLIVGTLLICGLNSYAQEKHVTTGQVLNSRNEPVSGVSVSVEGQSESPFITKKDGLFSINSDQENYLVTFTPFEKYKTKTVLFSGSENVIVYLTDNDIQSGSDLVLNIGEDEKRKNVISTILTTDSDKFKYIPYPSVDQFLQGNIPGVNFINHSGLPGSGGSMFIRGQSSINAGNMPLIIVDGLPMEDGALYSSLISGANYNPLSSISVQDISNISVLKGAASSLYGAKGSNGIILIETLKPKATNTSIRFSYKTGVNLKGKEIPQLNNRGYKTLASEILASSGILEERFYETAPGLYFTSDSAGYINYSHDYNWQKEVFTNSMIHDAYVSIMGGDAIGKYGLSVGYIDYEGVFKNTSFNRFASRFVGKFNMFEWLSVSISANLVNSKSIIKESALSRQTSPIISSLAKSPMQFPYRFDEEGEQLNTIRDVDELGVSNPVAVMDLFDANNSNTRFQTSVRFNADITTELKLISLLAINVNSLVQNSFYPNTGMELYDNNEVWNKSQTLTNNLTSIFNDNYLLYTKAVNNKHRFKLMAGGKWAGNTYEEDFGIARNLNENDEFTFLQAGNSSLRRIGGNTQNWNWFSAYASGSYFYKDKYQLELNSSADLSSKIGREATNVFLLDNVPFGLFYSGGFSWRLSNEEFFPNIKTLDELSLNLQYGIAGNDNVGTYNRHDYYRVTLYRETSGMVPGGFGNPALGYEQSKMFSAGTDLSFLGNRLRFYLEYFNTNITDMLIYGRLDSYLGTDDFPTNDASMVNSGYEFNLFTRMINSNNFNLDVSLNLTKLENEITDILDGEIITQLPGYSVINREGVTANSFYGYVYEGVYSTEEEAQSANLVNSVGIPYGAGDARYKDISGPEGIPDNIINSYDKEILGSGLPDFYGGLTLSLSYKNWNLNTQWYFVTGNKIFNYIRFQNEKMTDFSNQSISTLRRWTYEGQDTDIPKAKWNDPVGNADFSSRWIEDGSYIRCKNITLSYRVPEKVMIFRDLTIYASAVNLFTFSDYLGYDPEFSFSLSPALQGVDYGLMPQFRSIVFGVNLGL